MGHTTWKITDENVVGWHKTPAKWSCLYWWIGCEDEALLNEWFSDRCDYAFERGKYRRRWWQFWKWFAPSSDGVLYEPAWD